MTFAFVLIWTDFVWRMILSYEKWVGVTSRAFTWDSTIIHTTVNGRPLAKKEQRTVIYVRDMVTGLTFKQDRWNFKEGVLDYKRPWPKMSLRCGSDSRPQNSVW